MNLQEIETRLAAIRTECQADGADLNALQAEADNLITERRTLMQTADSAAERRRALLNSIANGTAGNGVGASPIDNVTPERRYSNAAPEYRRAFFAHLSGREESLTAEERRAYEVVNTEARAAFVGTTTTEAAVMPHQTLNEIWDLMATQHSIVDDVNIVRTGVIIDVPKRTSITQGKAKIVAEGAANDDMKDVKAKVTLSGKDFSATVRLSYAAAKMSIDALENFISTDIADQLGEAMATDLVETIQKEMATANKTAAASTSAFTFAEITKAFATLKRCRTLRAYVSNYTLYAQLVGMVDNNGRPIFQQSAQEGAQGAIVGAIIRLEDSVPDGTLLVGDPSRVKYNMVQDVMVETDKDIVNHEYIYSGYARGEGALMDDKSFAQLALKTT